MDSVNITHIHVIDRHTDKPVLVPHDPEGVHPIAFTTVEESTQQQSYIIATGVKSLQIDAPADNKVCEYCISFPETAYFPRGAEQPTPQLDIPNGYETQEKQQE